MSALHQLEPDHEWNMCRDGIHIRAPCGLCPLATRWARFRRKKGAGAGVTGRYLLRNPGDPARREWPETRPAPDGNDSIPILAGQRAACSNTVYLAHWFSSPRCLHAGHLPPSSRPSLPSARADMHVAQCAHGCTCAHCAHASRARCAHASSPAVVANQRHHRVVFEARLLEGSQHAACRVKRARAVAYSTKRCGIRPSPQTRHTASCVWS